MKSEEKSNMNMSGRKMGTVAAAMLAAFIATGISAATMDAAAWRGETAYVDIPERLQDKVTALLDRQQDDDISISLLRFDEVKYDLSELKKNEKGRSYREITGKGSVPDVCRQWRKGDKTKPTMMKISVKSDAKPGVRVFDFGKDGEKTDSLSLTVVDRVLPPAKEWKYFLDLWQHPWAVSRYFKVEPFSREHYAKMEPIWRALAECGCKALTVTLLDLPWNNQCYDGYYSMIGRVKKADGSWKFDYSLFDQYGEFGRKCGLGPDIACYSMCPWGYMVTWTDENGKKHREKALPGTAEFENYWGPFLEDFARHLKEKGWFEDLYIAMDERSPEDVRKISDLIQIKAPGMKISICGRTKPSAFDGIKIENFCQGLIHLRSDFLPELKPRRDKGFKTTFYVCFPAAHPNTFMHSPAAEGFWLGAYPVMIGFDGFLRWAANSWPKDPYVDASYRTEGLLIPGDTFLIYPGGELSSRLIALRSGVVAAEKMRILREECGDAETRIKRLAAPYGFRSAVKNKFDFSEFRRGVENFVNAPECRASVKVGSYNIRLSGWNGIVERSMTNAQKKVVHERVRVWQDADSGTPNTWKERKEDLVALIRRLDLDVFGLQEVCPDQAEFLRQNLSEYEMVGEHRGADRKSDEASPVCYRKSRFEALDKGTFWLSETPEKPGVIGWGAMCPRVCSYLILRDRKTGRRFCFANCHTDHKSALAREKGMLLVVERMKKFGAGAPIVFTGDHNCLENEAPAIAVAAVLKDALYASETAPKGSWRTCSGWKWRDSEYSISDALKLSVEERNAKSKRKQYGSRIDYIYVSDGVRVLDFETVNESRPGKKLYPSDHFPVVATVEL